MGYALALAIVLSGHWLDWPLVLPAPVFAPRSRIANDSADNMVQPCGTVCTYGIWSCGGTWITFSDSEENTSRDAKCSQLLLDCWQLPHRTSRELANSLFGINRPLELPCTIAQWKLSPSIFVELNDPIEPNKSILDTAFFTKTQTLHVDPKNAVIFFARDLESSAEAAYGIWNSGSCTIQFNVLNIGDWTRDVVSLESLLPTPTAMKSK